jgi:hypothetical protein
LATPHPSRICGVTRLEKKIDLEELWTMTDVVVANLATTTFALGSQFLHESKVVVAALSGE